MGKYILYFAESLEKEVVWLLPIDAVVLSYVAICLLYKIAEELFKNTEINTFPYAIFRSL